MTGFRLKLNRKGVEDLLKGSAAEDACRPKAEAAVGRARASAPVASGAYRASIHVEEVMHPTRKVFRVVADVPYALVVEADTGNLARSL